MAQELSLPAPGPSPAFPTALLSLLALRSHQRLCTVFPLWPQSVHRFPVASSSAAFSGTPTCSPLFRSSGWDENAQKSASPWGPQMKPGLSRPYHSHSPLPKTLPSASSSAESLPPRLFLSRIFSSNRPTGHAGIDLTLLLKSWAQTSGIPLDPQSAPNTG